MEEKIRTLININNPAALELIYDHFGPSLFGYLVNFLGNRQDAEDTMQQLFILIARNKHKLLTASNMKAYLFTMARNSAVTLIRKNNKGKDKEPISIEQELDASQNKILKERQESVRAAMYELPEDQREIVYLKIYNKQTFDSIAKHLNLSINTVSSRYRYGLQKLKSILLQEND